MKHWLWTRDGRLLNCHHVRFFSVGRVSGDRETFAVFAELASSTKIALEDSYGTTEAHAEMALASLEKQL